MDELTRCARYAGRHAWRAALRLKPETPDWLRHLAGVRFRGWYAHFSPGLEKIPYLAAFAGAPVLRLPIFPGAERLWKSLASGCRGVLAWGLKDKRDRATRFAARFGLPLLRLEDGFLRSLDLGVNGAAPLSLVVDASGIYYDATRPSDLENLLNATDWENAALLDEARKAMSEIHAHGLSKYNHAPAAAPDLMPDNGRCRVLVLDQTANDLSVRLGLADAQSFADMLRAALAEHPEADIYVKTHPDVLAGKKQGFFQPGALPAGVRLIDEDVAPSDLLRRADVIYTVSSQMGFEALLYGKPVCCFGMPFYAGWGLTADRQRLARRGRTRSLEEVFAAAYLLYARYVQPGLGRRCAIGEVIRMLAEQRRINERNQGYHACVGFKLWKEAHARAFLHSTRGTTEFFSSTVPAVEAARKKQGNVVVWASREPEDLAPACAAAGLALWRMEDGFLRSVGLGADYFRPGSLVLDDMGIYYDPARPSRLERLLRRAPTGQELETARRVRQEVARRGISKYNMAGAADMPALPAGKTVILVPGQVEDDASVRLGGCGIHSNAALLETVRARCPEAFLLYKEHPDVVSGKRVGRLEPRRIRGLADAVVRTTPVEVVLRCCHAVHTLTSLTGFEALLRDIPVWTYGVPFYAGWGLTRDRIDMPRRRRLPSIDHLVVGVLLRYPAYFDWNSHSFVDCESYIEYLDEARAADSTSARGFA